MSSLREEIERLDVGRVLAYGSDEYVAQLYIPRDEVLAIIDKREAQFREYQLAYGAVMEDVKAKEERPAREALDELRYRAANDGAFADGMLIAASALVEAIDALASRMERP